MAKRIVKQSGDVTRYFGSESGVNYRGVTQDIDPIIRRVESFREKVNEAPKAGNKNGWHYAGSIPMSVLHDWLVKHGYTLDQWARNAGGEPGKTRPEGPGVKDKFMRYFMSRDFAKLHTNHVTNRKERSSIIVPNYIGSKR